MLKELAAYGLNIAEKLGTTYVEARAQRTNYELITIDNGVLKEFSKTFSAGLGIRVFYNGRFGFSSTNDLNRESVKEAVEKAISAARVSRKVEKLGEREACKGVFKSDCRKKPEDVSDEEKVSLTLEANKAGLSLEGVKSAVTRLGVQRDWRYVVTSDGVDLEYESTLLGLGHMSVAFKAGAMERVGDQESAVAGWEFIEGKNWAEFSLGISKLANEAVKAPLPPPGRLKAVADPEMVGLILHEAFGHACEGDLVSSGDSILSGRLGSEIASPLVTIVDDGLAEGGYFVPFDDEGNIKRRVVVVENGVLKSFMTGRETAGMLNLPVSGNSRAQDFTHFPIVRQTNFFMTPRDHGFEEIIREAGEGVYILGRGATGGQVDTASGTFTFSAGPSWIIRNGELAELVRGVVISGSILETLKGVEAVGRDLRITTSAFGGCGKDNQLARVGDGGPHVMIRELIVGGG
ncbi:MAG: TldD/PmbA family protein [Candidatus Brockarchaeota archaeon]|nr:TldD/PmbA family protein [Candidatus Brockarchaeota archaeon]